MSSAASRILLGVGLQFGGVVPEKLRQRLLDPGEDFEGAVPPPGDRARVYRLPRAVGV